MRFKLALSLAIVLSVLVVAVRADEGAAGRSVRIELPAGEDGAGRRLAIDRLKEYAGGDVQVVSGGAVDPAARGRAGLTILLGAPGDSPELAERWKSHPNAPADSYLIATLSHDPPVVAASGVDARGTLYAAYHLADLLRAKAGLAEIDRFHRPKIGLRYVSFGATTHGRRAYRPDLFWKTLNELPSFGYNGVIIYPGGGSPIGRRSAPILETEAGELHLDAENTARWKQVLARVKDYQLEIMMTVPPVVPPGFDRKAIATFYAGGPEPKGYLQVLQAHFRKYLDLLRETYPESDRYMFNSTEGATFGRSERFFGAPAPDRFPVDAYLRNNEAVMTAYLDVLTDVFADRPDRLTFWTHSFGLTTDGIVKMRQVLFRYPRITIIEDDFWNNNLWPFDLPAMYYLPADLRAEVSSRGNPFALFQIATDGEYYGGGRLPNAFPGSHIRTAREALARNASMVIQRLDLHDRTPYGTAFGTMEIVPLAASRQLWEPTPDEGEIWLEWAQSRFGREAAPLVIDALQESHTILLKGLSCNGIDLLAVGSEFQPRLWMRDKAGLSRFNLFSKPGVRLVNKDVGDVITSPEYTAYQMKTRSIAIDEFRRNQAEAAEATRRGLHRIEQAKPLLQPDDYGMLHQTFRDGAAVLQAIRLLGEAAYATNLVLDNFDQVSDPRALQQRAIADLQTFIDSGRLIPEMNRNLSKILVDYKAAAETPQ